MKRLIKLSLFILLCIPSLVLAKGSFTVSTGSLSIVKGSSATVDVCANNAAGRVDLSTSGNISINNTSVFVDMGCTTITVTGKSVGNATITFNVVDGTDYDGNDLTGTKLTTSVNVYVPDTPTPPPSNPGGNGGGGGSTPRKSSNTDIKTVKIGEYSVTKTGNQYKTVIEDDIDKVTVTVVPSDGNAKVTGAGEKTIVDGDNTFTIKVTAENGDVKSYTILITKASDYINFEKIEENLTVDKTTLDVKLKNGDILTSELITKIKDSGKIVNLYYFDENKELLYIWVLDSAVISESTEFNPIINMNTEKKDLVYSKINYVESIIFELSSVAPEGAKLRFNIASKYDSNDNLNAYSFNESTVTITTAKKNEAVNFGAVHTNFYEFATNSDLIYIITKGTLEKQEIPTLAPKIIQEEPKNYLIPLIVESAVLLALIIYIIIVSIQNKKKLASIMANGSVETKDVVVENAVEVKPEETKAAVEVKTEVETTPVETETPNKEVSIENVKVEILEPSPVKEEAPVDTTVEKELVEVLNDSESFDKKTE